MTRLLIVRTAINRIQILLTHLAERSASTQLVSEQSIWSPYAGHLLVIIMSIFSLLIHKSIKHLRAEPGLYYIYSIANNIYRNTQRDFMRWMWHYISLSHHSHPHDDRLTGEFETKQNTACISPARNTQVIRSNNLRLASKLEPISMYFLSPSAC